MADETSQQAFDRGAVAGEISARLAGHDNHFAAINGHLAEMSTEMRNMKLALQRIEDAGDHRVLDTASTAVALMGIREEKRKRVEQIYFVIGIIGVLVAVFLSGLSVYLTIKK
jgi:hypothetical protein